MLVISEKLTVGQVTFILRVIIQILTYGGLFLLGRIILGQSHRVALFETHDVLNRIVGKGTATTSTLKWIIKRVFGKRKDPISSGPLLLALLLSLSYGLLVSLSDVGFIGLYLCDVGGSTSVKDFPGSVKSQADARALLNTNMLNGTDPNSVNSYRCDSAVDTVINSNQTTRVCNTWHNSTYGDPTDFRGLNSTDSDTLMAKNLAKWNPNGTDSFDLNVYFIGTTGESVPTPIINGGLAIIPHDIGVQMVVGVPNLSSNQQVTIPKTLAFEMEMGCMSLGMSGEKNSADMLGQGSDFFKPDDVYHATRMEGYTGPENLRDILAQTADEVRDIMRQWFNSSDVASPDGSLRSFNSSYGTFSWQTKASKWSPDLPFNSSVSDLSTFILGNCTERIQQALNISLPAETVREPQSSCGLYSLVGSLFIQQTPLQVHGEMVCATTSQVNMVSATINVDGDGQITANLSHLPSDLQITEALYFNITSTGSADPYDILRRFTLADNPEGQLQHFIYQEYTFSSTPSELEHGSGSVGRVLSLVGGSMVGVADSYGEDSTLGLINATYFSVGNFSTKPITKWAGSVGASMLQGSLGYNPWTALDREALDVVITGGRAATCYNYRYGAAFLPLSLAALGILCWAIALFISSRIRGAKRWEAVYGGLAPVVISPEPGKPPADAVLEWEDETQPLLRHMDQGTPMLGESEALISDTKDEIEYYLK